ADRAQNPAQRTAIAGGPASRAQRTLGGPQQRGVFSFREAAGRRLLLQALRAFHTPVVRAEPGGCERRPRPRRGTSPVGRRAAGRLISRSSSPEAARSPSVVQRGFFVSRSDL